jgi:hypothetical protein
VDRTEYFARPEAARALDELAEACFAIRERREDEDAFPNAMDFLRERDIDPPGSGTISVRHSVEEVGTTVDDLKPGKVGCPEGKGRLLAHQLQNDPRAEHLLVGLRLSAMRHSDVIYGCDIVRKYEE